ncbi:MAG: DUF1287 domain-containing protein [Opitutaceae bacterium]
MHRLLPLLIAFLLPSSVLVAQPADGPGSKIAAGAREQISVTTSYDPSYVKLTYPGGDVPSHTGVCSDVVVRALRTVGIDLQKEVHEDMRGNFSAYPKNWGLKAPDKNIDHRRVPNLMRYFERKHTALGEKWTAPETYLPGDIVAWRLDGGLLHIGVVSGKKSGQTPLIIHNIGAGAKEENVLFAYKVIGHYRIK